ncbi:hypothetical protein RvY_06691 [Ramazzottius varieornatus]|uniref:Ubiquitin-like domain-containing protein n=1 Tax=Ramazzottius varieornatus TaxID=947166 RepID=A0A1D1UZV3_RAMVA|nr:hypothetical protein RvY_06691 [Ramazzottius varieornatus]
MATGNGEITKESDASASTPVPAAPSIEIKVTYNKQTLDIVISSDSTVWDLKEMVNLLTGIPADKQKLMWSRGACPDDKTLVELGAKSGSKFMMVGSSLQEVKAVQSKPDASTLKDLQEFSPTKKEKLSEATMHQKVLSQGIPPDAMPGILNEHDPLPPIPISGMLTKQGHAVRLTFKLEADQVWIGTKERTQKVSLGQIRKVVSEPIVGHEEYHIMGLQMGPTEASLYWLYWVPAQYVRAIKAVFSQFDLGPD